jgi:phage terminase Nu1 subunit (DNA packaging protein)
MADQFTYYTPEAMKGKKLSDLKQDPGFLKDAVTFLKSRRKGWSDDELKQLTPEDVTYEVLEHFRIINTNEVSMSRDYYYVKDNKTDEKEKQSYARLMNAFDNAKGEGILDGGFAGVRDYAEGFLTAPSTYVSAAALPLTGGAGTAAVQAAKEGSKQALKQLAKHSIKRGLLDVAFEGSVAAASQLGQELIKKEAGETIGEDYDVSGTNIALAGALGGAAGGVAYAIPTRQQYKGAQRMVDTLQAGDAAKAKRMADKTNRAVEDLKKLNETAEGRKYIKFSKDKLLASIDPKLVQEGMEAKVDILSENLPDGLIGGLDRGTIQRLSAASVELARTLGVKAEKGERITEYLARRIEAGDGETLFDTIADRYGLTRRQLAAVYAAEVSEAARILVQQKQFKNAAGKMLTGKEASEAAGKFKDKLDELYDIGMSTVSGQEAKELSDAQLQLTRSKRIVRSMRNVEDARRAFMTSQPATTMRNNIFGVAMTGIDVLDQFNAYMIRSVRGKESAAATLDGATDIANYLLKDQYVADAAVELLRQDAPELMQKVFRDAAQAEAGVVKDTKLAKLGTFVNSFNTMSDHIFKKAVVAGTIDRELKKQGSSLAEYLEKGMMSEIDDSIIKKALDDSLDFTFQSRFGGKDASETSKFVNKTIGFIHRSGATTIIPFPRYLASQAKFIKNYSVLNIAYKGGKLTDEEWAKQITGAAVFGSAYMYQKDNIEQGLNWFEDQMLSGEVTNAQAAMGPTAPIHYAANIAARISMGMPNDLLDDQDRFSRNMLNLMLGSEFRPSSTAIDEVTSTMYNVAKAIADGETDIDMQPVAKILGDYFSTFTYPAAVVKDFYGQYDPRASYFPQTLDATVSLADIGGPRDPKLYLYSRFAKNLADFNLNEMSATLKEATGIDMGESQLEGLMKWMGSSTRTHFQMMDPDNRDTGYDAVRHDVYGDGPIRQLDPLLKQITGFTKSAPPNELKREMAKLNIDPFELYNPYREKNSALELLTQQIAQGSLAEEVEAFITSDPIYTSSNMDRKRNLLRDKIKNVINKKRDTARTLLTDFAAKNEEYQSDFNAYIRGEYTAMGPKETADADAAWGDVAGRYGFEGMDIKEAIAEINSSDQYDEAEKDSRRSVLLLWYINAGKLEKKVRRAATQAD